MMRITGYRWVPPFAQGYVRDLRARWACEEAGIPYEISLIDLEQRETESYRREQPFGQVPVLQDGELTLFESGAMVLYIGEKSDAILPIDLVGRARAKTWMFAALNSVEPVVQNLVEIEVFHRKEEWALGRRPFVIAALKKRLDGLNHWLENREYLEDRFTVGDLMMSSVLRNLDNMNVIEEYPTLFDYRQRCLARPAFKKVHAEQLKNFVAPAAK